MKPVSASVLPQHCNIFSGLYAADHGSHTPLQDDGTSVGSIQRRMCETERHRQMSELVGAMIVGGWGVLKCTLAVDNDRTVHGVHSDTVAFSLNIPHQVYYLCLPHLLTRTPPEWLKKTILEILS